MNCNGNNSKLASKYTKIARESRMHGALRTLNNLFNASDWFRVHFTIFSSKNPQPNSNFKGELSKQQRTVATKWGLESGNLAIAMIQQNRILSHTTTNHTERLPYFSPLRHVSTNSHQYNTLTPYTHGCAVQMRVRTTEWGKKRDREDERKLHVLFAVCRYQCFFPSYFTS